jgi:hypothetical protein
VKRKEKQNYHYGGEKRKGYLLMSGLGIQAANGATKKELKRYAEMALSFLGY